MRAIVIFGKCYLNTMLLVMLLFWETITFGQSFSVVANWGNSNQLK